MENNIFDVSKKPCTSCFSCSLVCGKGAISIEQDNNGFYKPVIDNNKCIHCGLCKTVCYSHSLNIENHSKYSAYFGWHRTNEIRNLSSSGGISSSLAKTLIKNGFVVFGCSYDYQSKSARHIMLKGEEEIYKIRGSKYFQSNLKEMISDLKLLDKSSKIAVFGLPCQILGLKAALKIAGFNDKNIFTVELFCHGVLSIKIWHAYIRSKPKYYSSENICFRTKHYGWHVPSISFKKGYKIFHTKRAGDVFFRIFYSKSAFNESCYSCECRAALGNADLRIGDFWGERFRYNKEGVSCILCFTEAGKRILELCNNNFYLEECDPCEILQAQSYNAKHIFDRKKWDMLYSFVSNGESINKILRCAESDLSLMKKTKNKIYYIISNVRNKK